MNGKLIFILIYSYLIVKFLFSLSIFSRLLIILKQLLLMGNGSTIEASTTMLDRDTLKSTIQQNLNNRRLKLNHQSNIFEKCGYLYTHYKQYSADFDELYLTHNMISVEVMNQVAKMSLDNLKTLCLSNNDINCQSMNSLKFMPLKTLEYLFLDHNQIANDGCFYVTSPNLQSLLTLDLNDNKIQDEGCRNLARANLPNLRTLLIWLIFLSKGEWPLLAFVQAKQNLFEPNKELQKIKFRSDVKVFRLEIH